jgi:hypothetical protein
MALPLWPVQSTSASETCDRTRTTGQKPLSPQKNTKIMNRNVQSRIRFNSPSVQRGLHWPASESSLNDWSYTPITRTRPWSKGCPKSDSVAETTAQRNVRCQKIHFLEVSPEPAMRSKAHAAEVMWNPPAPGPADIKNWYEHFLR